MATTECPREVHVEDIGTIFQVNLKDCKAASGIADISEAIVKEILFYKPDETVVIKPAEFYTDGEDGILQYIARSGDLDIVGTWKIQGRISNLDIQRSSSIEKFKVLTNLDTDVIPTVDRDIILEGPDVFTITDYGATVG